MKKILLPLMLALTPALYAGGNTVPQKASIVEIPPPIVVDNSAWYLGLGASMMSLDADLTDESMDTTGVTLQAGYAYNEYIAIELRYTANASAIDYDRGTTANANNDDYPSDFTNVGIYLKPTYPMGDFGVYALLGYGSVTFTDLPTGTEDRTEDGFQWGLGASYQITEAIGIFADYTKLYDDTGMDGHFTTSDISVELVTVGMNYRF